MVDLAILQSSLSLVLDRGAGHHPNPFQKLPEALWIGCKHEQMPVMNSQEPDPGGLLCFAGPVRSETSGK